MTAGHDSFFNETTTPVVGRLMTGPLAALDVDFESRNVALGNNPCVPYDVCVKVFVGEDADMVHWEQNYFCGGDPLEYFIRQVPPSSDPLHPPYTPLTHPFTPYSNPLCPCP